MKPKTPTPKQAAKQKLVEAKAAYEYQSRLLKAHEKLWQEAWAAAINPFKAWKEYKANRKKRLKILAPWIAARDYYDSLPKPKEQI